MTHLFIGWDVGAWHCDDGESRDALCVLKADPGGPHLSLSDLSSLDLVASPVRTNLRDSLNAQDPLGATLEAAHAERVVGVTHVWVAIDTPLGWPLAFRKVLDGSSDLPFPATEIADNPYLFRITEKMLSRNKSPRTGEFYSPLSAVKDMIGAQSTKGLHFLRRAGLALKSPGVWAGSGSGGSTWTAVETYPTPARESTLLGSWWSRLEQHSHFYRGVQATWVNHRSDIRDSLWCALVAAVFAAAPGELVLPPPALAEIVNHEGWIWLPMDAFSASDPTGTLE